MELRALSHDHLRMRGVAGDVVAAGPELALSLTCLSALILPEVAMRVAPSIRLGIAMEFLAIHSFVFLGYLALRKPRRWWTHALRAGAFVAVCIFYSWFAYNWGTDAVASFWLLTLSTYFGFFVHDAPEQRRQLLICRWLVVGCTYLVLLAIVLISAELLDVRSPRRELLVGFAFFSTLAVFDLIRLYDRIAPRLMSFIRTGTSSL